MHKTITEFQHEEHKEWLSKIDFYQEQVMVFQKELLIALHQHPDLFSIIEHVDEYRGILLKKLRSLDEMRRQIILHEKAIAKNVNTVTVEIWDHHEVRNRLKEFEENFEMVKGNIRKFVAHQMDAN